uniref:Matrilin 2 n=1 Tax=Leptobrachium leishanense TaxID=445787 RepID=A0A8C5MT00_9ANUR
MRPISSSTLVFLVSFVLAAEGREKRQSSRTNEIEAQSLLLKEACQNKPLDLVFVIDSSRSVRPYDFEKVKEFLITMLKFLDIRPEATRVGLLQYGSTVKNEFSLKTFKKKSDIERAVKRMMHLATGTMTGLALQYTMNIAFSEAEGARPPNEFVPRIAMIVTDGRPQDPVAEISTKARNSGILIFAVGVGRVDMTTLNSIGSEPHEEHVFLVANFSQIETLTSVFQNKLCAPHLCATKSHGCDHFCINTPGSYICRCKQGYILNPDEKTCKTQDLCAMEQHGCEQICVNTPGSFLCQCYEGYELKRDGKSCRIVDYCALDTHGCQHDCVNDNDFYVCQCRPGFILNPDKKTCSRPDYCALSNHGCQHECVNTDDSYYCKCRSGFSLNADKKTCKKINYCALGNHGCEHECVNTDSSYVCKCRKGYSLNLNGKTCRKIDHCAESNHGCQHICINMDESHLCQCYEGFVVNEDLKTCSAVDHCAINEHGCEHLCVSAEGSFTCQCFEGFVLRDDKKTCRNTDLCKSIEHGCEHICMNNNDSYICKCFDGYNLAEDGQRCKRITIYAVGVGKAIDEELREIASAPQDKHVIHAEDFTSMGYITEKLKSSICEGWTNWKPTIDLSNPDLSSEFKAGSSEVTVSCSMTALKFTSQSEEKSTEEQCQCKNIMDFQSNANEEMKRLTQQLAEMTRRMQILENRLGER